MPETHLPAFLALTLAIPGSQSMMPQSKFMVKCDVEPVILPEMNL
jgi:hypothetical protein